MSANVATRKRHRVADPLRDGTHMLYSSHRIDMEAFKQLLAIADQIDREHERRMDQAREDSRKHTCNYISRIIADYKRGRKWVRKEYE